MGLTLYKPPGNKRRVHPLVKFFIAWMIVTFAVICIWDLGAWLRTGMWHW